MFRDTGYTLIAEFPGFDMLAPVDEQAHYKGFILEKNTHQNGGTVVTPYVSTEMRSSKGAHAV